MLEFNEYLTVAEAMLISLISISIVFIILAFIAVIISCIGKCFKDDTTENNKDNSTASTVKEVKQEIRDKVDLSQIKNDEHKLIAILVASIEANKNDEDKKYRVISVKGI